MSGSAKSKINKGNIRARIRFRYERRARGSKEPVIINSVKCSTRVRIFWKLLIETDPDQEGLLMLLRMLI